MVVLLDALALLFHPGQGLLTLTRRFPCPLASDSSPLACWLVEGVGLVGQPLLSALDRGPEMGAFALLMQIGTDKLPTAIVDIERTMVNYALETVFLNLGSLSIGLWAGAHLQGRLYLRRAPVTKLLAFGISTMTK